MHSTPRSQLYGIRFYCSGETATMSDAKLGSLIASNNFQLRETCQNANIHNSLAVATRFLIMLFKAAAFLQLMQLPFFM